MSDTADRSPESKTSKPRSEWKSPAIIISVLQFVVIGLGGIGAVYLHLVGDRPPRTAFEHDIQITDLGPAGEGSAHHHYLIEYNYSFGNKGPLQSMDVSYVVVSALVGDFEIGAEQAYLVKAHCTGADQNCVDGFVDWSLLETQGYRSDRWKDSYVSEYSNNEVTYRPFRGGAGTIKAGGKSSGSMALVVKALPKRRLITFETRFGIDGFEDNQGKYRARERWRERRVALIEEDNSRAQSGKVIP